MKLDIIMQNEEINLAKCIASEMQLKPKKMYVFAGSIKESGFDILEENIIDTKVKLVVYMGIDKKNTTKSLLESLLEYTDEIYYYNNNELKEFEGTSIIFENDKRAAIYFISSKLSENGMTEDLVMISKITYDLSDSSDKAEYKEKVKEFLSLKDRNFNILTSDKISDLVNQKIIFSNKQYEHNVKSIAELLGKKEEKKEEKKKVESSEDIDPIAYEIPKVELNNDFGDFDIDVSMVSDVYEKKEEVKSERKLKLDVDTASVTEEFVENLDELEENYEEESENDEVISSNEIIDLDSMLFTKADIKLKEKKENKKEVKKEEEKFEESEIVKVKKVDLNNITNLIMELPGKQANKKDLDLIKIPNYIKDLIPAFFEFPDKSTIVDEGGVQVKERDIKVELIDCKNDKKYMSDKSKIFQRKGQTFISIKCEELANIEYDENDVVRIIKLSDDIYHIEIVSKDMQEYKIWSKIMNQNFRASTRKYGIM